MRKITYEDYQRSIGKEIRIAGTEFRLEKPAPASNESPAFELETTTVYSFKKRGNWATHGLNASYRGNFTPEIARNMILRYSKEGECVMDPFCGSGTTLVEARELGRNCIGADINEDACLLAWNRLDYGNITKVGIYEGDARNLEMIADESVDLVIAHPPYANIIKYTDHAGDLSLLSAANFVPEMKKVAREMHRTLKKDAVFALLIGDTRKNGVYLPIAYETMKACLEFFVLKEDIIKIQWNCKTTPYWKEISKQYNFHLIMHEHLFVFQKK